MDDHCNIGLQLEEIDWLFRRMVRKFVKERDKISIAGIPLPAVLILLKIARDGEQKLGDLAEELDFSPGAITALCDKLEKAGFAERRRTEEDRRSVLLGITDKGRALLLRHRKVSRKQIQVLFGGFAQQELAVLKEAFLRITDNLAGFAETIMAVAAEEGEQPGDAGKPDDQNANCATQYHHFLNY